MRGIIDENLHGECPRTLIDCRTDEGDFSVEHFLRIRFDHEIDRQVLADQVGIFFLDAGLELQRIHPDDGHHRRILANVFATLNRPLRNGSFDRRSDDGVAQLLFGQLESGFPVLQTCF